MRVKSMLTVGFLSMMAATALVNASDSFAHDVQRVDVIGTIHETVAQLDSQLKSTESDFQRVDVSDSIVSEGPVYAYTKSMSH